jgi:molybdopterin synthase catalytic subunit
VERDPGADCLLLREPLDPARMLAAVSDAVAGANVLFVGTTRGITDGLTTSRLVYDAHEPLARGQLERLRAEAVGRFGLSRCVVHHRLGPVAVGEASVVIAASAPHRREAFAAAEWLMEQIKRAVPIWKCEEGPDGSRIWMHPDAPPAVSATTAAPREESRA